MQSENIHILDQVSALNYFDSQSIVLPEILSPLAAWNQIMVTPLPFLKLAFRVRDGISSKFGVKRIGGFTGVRKETVNVGDKIDFFLVEHVSENALVLTERDRHLDVMTCISTAGHELTITSSVKTHNAFGRAYMVPVGVAHKVIVRTMLKRLKESLDAIRPARQSSLEIEEK